MGKASKWFRNLLGLKKTDSPPPPPAKQPPPPPPNREKRRWSFVKSHRDRDRDGSHRPQRHNSCPAASVHSGDLTADPNKHAIAVAAASAAAAEAAVMAARAAAEVVRLTSSGRCADSAAAYGAGSCAAIREEVAALKIQSAFRGYLARRALRALKGLVKIQALVRGHIERKRTAQLVRKMQALLRAQARACAERAQLSESPQSSSKSSHFHHPGPATPEKSEYVVRSKSSRQDQLPVLRRNGSRASGRIVQERAPLGRNWSDHEVEERLGDQCGLSAANSGHADDEKSDKILEIDPGKPSFTPKRRSLVQSSRHALPSDQASHSYTTSKDSMARQSAPSPSSCEVQSLSPLDFSHEVEEGTFRTADNSPQFYSVSSRGGGSSRRSPFTPTKSDGSRSYLSGYSDHPNYMAYTESSKAKVRSMSAPKQRPHFDKSSSTKRYSVQGFGESRSISQKVLSLHTNFVNKAYPGSGRLDRLGMPVRGDGHGYGY